MIVDLLISFAGVVIGGLITWIVARKYYVRASEDLRIEADSLKGMTKLMLRAMEEAGLVKFTKDEKGIPKGLYISLEASDMVAVKGEMKSNLERDEG